jgi:beta-hydroxylase
VRVVLFVDFLRPCRWPVSWLNRLLVFLARYSPLVQSAKKNQQNWERRFYGAQRRGPLPPAGADAPGPPA